MAITALLVALGSAHAGHRAPADAPPALAQARIGQGFVRQPSVAPDGLRQPIQPLKSRQQAINEALDRYGGEVLSAKMRGGSEPAYEIRLIDAGQVRVVRIDARLP